MSTSTDWPWCVPCRSYHHPSNPDCKARPRDETPTKPVEVDIYRSIPLVVLGTLDLWLRRGLHPGDGMLAVLENDLRAAVARWDDDFVSLRVLCRYLWNRCPANAYGSPEAVEGWRMLPNDVRDKLTNDSAHAVYFARRSAA